MSILLYLAFFTLYILCYKFIIKPKLSCIEKDCSQSRYLSFVLPVYEMYLITFSTVAMFALYAVFIHLCLPSFVQKMPRTLTIILFALGIGNLSYSCKKIKSASADYQIKETAYSETLAYTAAFADCISLPVYMAVTEGQISNTVQVLIILAVGVVSVFITYLLKKSAFKML